METNEKINVRGSIKALQTDGTPLVLPRPDYIPSTVRNTASSVGADFGRTFTVGVTKEEITVIRTS